MTAGKGQNAVAVKCVQCGSEMVKRHRAALGVVLMAFGVFILILFAGSNLKLATPRGLGNVAVGAISIGYGYHILRRGRYRCQACGHLFQVPLPGASHQQAEH